MHANGARLLGGDAAKCFGILDLARCTKRHGMRKFGGPVQAHAYAAFEISANYQRQLRILLQTVEQHSRFVGLIAVEKRRVRAHRHSKGANVVLVHRVTELQILRAVHVEKLRPRPNHKKLADLFFGRQLVQSSLRPFLAVTIEANGSRNGVLFLRQRCRGNQDAQHQ